MKTTFRAITDKPGLKPSSFLRRSESHSSAHHPFTHAVIVQLQTDDARHGLWAANAFAGSLAGALRAQQTARRHGWIVTEVVPVEVVA